MVTLHFNFTNREFKKMKDEVKKTPEKCEQAGASLRNALKEMEVRLKEQTDELNELRAVNEQLQVQLDERVMMTDVLHENEQQFRALVASIPGAVYRFHIESEWIIEFISDGIEEITAFPASYFRWQPVQTYRNIIHSDDQKNVERAICEGMGPLETFSVEYRVNDANGRLRWFTETGQAVFSAEGEPVWLDGVITDDSDRKFAEEALQRANQELARLATVDGLTQIANRRRFDEYLKIEWQRLRRAQQEMALVLCDIDCFKLFNDNYGHLEGDKCLQAVSKAIQSAVKRPADLAARYGGEEFVILLPNTSSDGAGQLAEDIRTKVQNLNIPHSYSNVAPCVTLSLGIASVVPNSWLPPEKLIVAADEALYEAKDKGRNRVVVNRRFSESDLGSDTGSRQGL